VTSDVLGLAEALIRIPSPNPPSEERPLAEWLARWLRGAGIAAEVMDVDGPGAPQANVFARIPGRSSESQRPPFILCGHLDTVPAGEDAWTRDPLAPAREGGRLYGLGASDMKGAVAAMCIAAARTAAGPPLAGDLLLAFTSGEETGSRGARAMARSGLLDGAGGVLIGEPTGNNVAIAEKGGLWLDVVMTGRTAHGSLPHLGANAIAGLAEALVLLESAAAEEPATRDGEAARALRAALRRPAHPMLGAPTLTVTRMSGGVASNVVPDRAVAVLDIRTVPGQSGASIQTAVESALADVAALRGLAGQVVSRGERLALEMPADHPLVQACAAVVEQVTGRPAERCALTGATDATELVPGVRTAAGSLPFVICGPGQMAQAHQPDEWVSLAALEASVEIYERLARAVLA
jgi:succinyl-diaminopimelate desuccinylase